MRGDVIIAARGGLTAKTRCRPATGESCPELVEVMLHDMLQALKNSASVRRTILVTPTPSLCAIADEHHAEWVLEPAAAGMACAFDAGRRLIAEQDPQAIVALLPADLPLIEPADIDAAFAAHRPDGVTLVASKDDGGTGAILLAAGQRFELAYGPGSFDRHALTAHRASIQPQILPLANIAADIDRSHDLDMVLVRRPETRTAQFLHRTARATEHIL